MLTKSKRSAFVMASVVSLTYSVTILFINVATRYATTGTVPSPQAEFNNMQGSWQVFVVLIAALLILISLGGLLIYALFNHDSHFGISGVIRWGLFGILDATLMKLYPSLWAGLSHPFVLQKIAELAIVLISYFVVFKMIPLSHQGKKVGIS